MNCADSVLNSDELPVRGIDQCPSTLSTQWNPGLVLVKWNRLLPLFKRAWLNSCFVGVEAFFKMCKSSVVKKKTLFFSPYFLWGIQRCSFCEYLSILSFGLNIRAFFFLLKWIFFSPLQKPPKNHINSRTEVWVCMSGPSQSHQPHHNHTWVAWYGG